MIVLSYIGAFAGGVVATLLLKNKVLALVKLIRTKIGGGVVKIGQDIEGDK